MPTKKNETQMRIRRGLRHLVTSDPEIVGGEPCFTGTRVPLETVVDNLGVGHTAQEILDNYRALRLEHVEAVLRGEQGLPH